MRHYRFSDETAADIHEIWSYIAEDNPSAADDLMDRFYSAFERIARYPRIGRSRNELRRALRSLAVENYVIYYSIAADHVKIVRVLSGYRDAEAQFGRK